MYGSLFQLIRHLRLIKRVPFYILTNPHDGTKLKFKKEYHMAKGTIRKLMDRGFGFIKTEDGTDLFFHSNELEGVEFNSLSEGQEVEYEKSRGRDNRPAAVKVKLVGTENSQAEAGVEEESETSKEEPEADIAEEPEK
jgi:CspA family cold shock protein